MKVINFKNAYEVVHFIEENFGWMINENGDTFHVEYADGETETFDYAQLCSVANEYWNDMKNNNLHKDVIENAEYGYELVEI